MANLTDADKVLRNDTGKDIVTQLTAIKTAIENGGGGSGASTVSQLTDVLLDSTIPDGDVLVRDNNLTGGKLWKNATTTIECTQAQYDALTTPQTDVNYYITDAPSMQGSSKDLSYDGTTLSTYDKIKGLNASDLPISSIDPTNTKDYIDGKMAIHSALSSTPIDVDDTYQIPTAVLNHSIIVITFRRYGYGATCIVLKEQILGGVYDTRGPIGMVTTSMNWNIAISNSGLITMKAKADSTVPYIEVFGYL